MTFDELQKEAKELGYYLTPISKYEKFEPCTCGCNSRDHLYIASGEIVLQCKNCRRSARGKNLRVARHNWNLMIQEIRHGKHE